MMVCVEAIKHLYEFMDKEIDKSQYPIIKEHLDNCFECRQRYEFEKGVRSLVKAYCINTTAHAYLHSKIIESLNSVDAEISENKDIQALSEQKVTRALFSPRFYAVAASILLLIAGGVFYYANYYNYNNDFISIVDNAVKNHVVAVNDNLVFNEKTSVVGNVNKYIGNTINSKLSNSSPILNAEQVRIVGGLPVKFSGTSSPCVIFDKGGNKLSLQIIRNNDLPIRNLERTQLGPKEFYIGNCRGFNAVIWEEEGSTYCLTSDINKNEMLRFAATLTSR
jgi:mycothiol system anti-sigma-R factor